VGSSLLIPWALRGYTLFPSMSLDWLVTSAPCDEKKVVSPRTAHCRWKTSTIHYSNLNLS